MTQGEEHRNGTSPGEFRRSLELSHRSDPTVHNSHAASGTSSSQSLSEVLLPPCHLRPTNQQSHAHGGEDAKNLLKFVHHASCDIKAALDQGNYSRKYFKQHSPSAIDGENDAHISESVKKPSSPIRRFSPEGMLSQRFHRHAPHPTHTHSHPRHHFFAPGHERNNTTKETLADSEDAHSLRSSRDELLSSRHDLTISFRDREMEHRTHVENGLKGVELSCKDGDEETRRTEIGGQRKEEFTSRQNEPDTGLDLFSYVDMLRENSLKRGNENEQENSGSDSCTENEPVTLRGTMEEKKRVIKDDGRDEKSNKINSVPLRKRRLPASFWQEPKGKSDNHRILTRPGDHSLESQPRSFVHHPGLSLFGQLKLPIPSPLSPGHFDFDFGLGRHFCADKNPFAFPTTSSASPFLNLNLPYRSHLPLPIPHGVDDRHRHGLAVPCGNNVCMCHLQNLAACSSNVCELSSQSASGLFGRSPTIPPLSPLDTTTSSALALNRWSAMQSMDSTPDLLGGYPMPRVFKPIPTKSLTSYPPRFHPIFT